MLRAATAREVLLINIARSAPPAMLADLVEHYGSLSIVGNSHIKLVVQRKHMGSTDIYRLGAPRTVLKQLKVLKKYHKLVNLPRCLTRARELCILARVRAMHDVFTQCTPYCSHSHSVHYVIIPLAEPYVCVNLMLHSSLYTNIDYTIYVEHYIRVTTPIWPAAPAMGHAPSPIRWGIMPPGCGGVGSTPSGSPRVRICCTRTSWACASGSKKQCCLQAAPSAAPGGGGS